MIMEEPDEDQIDQSYIWSHDIAVGKKSFVDNRQKYQKLAPPPIYLEGKKLL